jgi:hypothetical protein
MSRTSVLLTALTDQPATTSDVYDRVGYAALVRIGLVPYEAFRRQLVSLEADGLAASHVGEDGATLWRRRA